MQERRCTADIILQEPEQENPEAEARALIVTLLRVRSKPMRK